MARCSRPGGWCAESFHAVPIVTPFSSTSSSKIASAVPFYELCVAVAGVIGIPILHIGPRAPSVPYESGTLGTSRHSRMSRAAARAEVVTVGSPRKGPVDHRARRRGPGTVHGVTGRSARGRDRGGT